ncbi:hypothetical protein [Nonomuraea sp. SYSU D8015]|uniref:hypothetical protein n=1 Tax=Nonomuraea sp. SYSU D8015 TaxID=2593644 RepID=UPI001660DBE4|nr:hypothetical protein [Nonomuraea sp. SYSU D8015]
MKLFESHDTRRASWPEFGACVNDGRCDACPIMTAEPPTLRSFTRDVLVRIAESGEPCIMNKPETGWSSSARQWTWDDLARVQGWELGNRYSDEHGDGFWLHAAHDATNGIYGAPAAGRGRAQTPRVRTDARPRPPALFLTASPPSPGTAAKSG